MLYLDTAVIYHENNFSFVDFLNSPIILIKWILVQLTVRKAKNKKMLYEIKKMMFPKFPVIFIIGANYISPDRK